MILINLIALYIVTFYACSAATASCIFWCSDRPLWHKRLFLFVSFFGGLLILLLM